MKKEEKRKSENKIFLIKSLIGISKNIYFKYKKNKNEIFIQIPFLAVQLQRIKA